MPLHTKRAIRDASAGFLADHYLSGNRWRRNSNSLRKMYGLNDDADKDLAESLVQKVVDDLKSQLAEKSIPESKCSCPECSGKMSLLHIGEIEIDYCTSCEGIWFDLDELKECTGKEKDVPSDNLRGRNSRYCCPVCHAGMKEFVFQNPHNLLVDQCPFGHGVYLEKDELQRALSL